ncbi:hypothetical protein [Novosphingobium sp.]|uniref:hypothetical protein n=1 Tax=Novosphingobium sp. TaxID=1874826 RepID=UPI0025D2C0B1|nr:hypothetical protein [Novosphingobium sp.]
MTQSTKTELATDRLTERVALAKSRATARAERAAESAANAGNGAIGLIKKHPIVTVGGALVVGVVAAQLLPGKIGTGSRKNSRRAFELAAAAAEIALAYGKRASDSAAETGRDSAIRLGHAGHEFSAKTTDRLNDLASELGNRLSDTGDVARKRGTELAGSAAGMARDASVVVARKLRDLASKLDS